MAEEKAEIQRQPKIEPISEAPSHEELQPSFIGQGLIIEGKFSGKGNLIIQGRLKGEIQLDGYQIIIEDEGKVEADIQARGVHIRGEFKGHLTAEGFVQLHKTARFEGELKAARLLMEDGARLKGSVELQNT
jgi:cytoskeletal protein CcmA (bactofilin family)